MNKEKFGHYWFESSFTNLIIKFPLWIPLLLNTDNDGWPRGLWLCQVCSLVLTFINISLTTYTQPTEHQHTLEQFNITFLSQLSMFLYFSQKLVGILKKCFIYHMKVLKVAIWFCHDKGRGCPKKTAMPLRVNIGPFSLKLICWVLGQSCSQFQILSQFSWFRALFWDI